MNDSLDQGYYDENNLKEMGFCKVGRNVKIATNCVIVGRENIVIGDNVRIDSFCSIVAGGDGRLELGSFIHIAGYCYIAAGDGITMEDFVGLSQGVKIYSRSDDYGGSMLTNPTVPEKYRCIVRGSVHLRRHVIIGSSTVILPGVTIGEGASIGAMSLVTKSLLGWGVYFGCPVQRIKERSRKLLDLEQVLLAEIRSS